MCFVLACFQMGLEKSPFIHSTLSLSLSQCDQIAHFPVQSTSIERHQQGGCAGGPGAPPKLGSALALGECPAQHGLVGSWPR